MMSNSLTQLNRRLPAGCSRAQMAAAEKGSSAQGGNLTCTDNMGPDVYCCHQAARRGIGAEERDARLQLRLYL